MRAGHFGCAALARLAELFRFQPLRFLVGALFGLYAQRSDPVVPWDAGVPAALDGFELSGVSLLAQVLPQRRGEYGGFTDDVDLNVPGLFQLWCPTVRVPEYEKQLIRGWELFERGVFAQLVQFPQARDDLAGVDFSQSSGAASGGVSWAFWACSRCWEPLGTAVAHLGSGLDHPERRCRRLEAHAGTVAP